MEKDMKNGHDECHGMMCGWCNKMGGNVCPQCGKRHFMMFKLVKVVIIFLILWAVLALGVKLGEVKSYTNYGYGMMSGRYTGYPMMGSKEWNWMQNCAQKYANSTSTESAY